MFELNIGFYFLKYVLSLEMFRAALVAVEVNIFCDVFYTVIKSLEIRQTASLLLKYTIKK